MSRTLRGTVTLLHQIYVAEGVLGESFAGAVDLAAFSLTIPALPTEHSDGIMALTCPIDDDRLRSSVVDDTWGTTAHFLESGKPRNLSSYIKTVAIEVEAESDQDLAIFTATFGKKFTDWFAIATQWLELWAKQVLSPYQGEGIGTRGRLWENNAPPPGRSGWHAHRVVVHIGGSHVDRNMLHTACRNATESVGVPPEWRLYLSASRTHDNRLAVIEAASAAEVALSRALDTRLPMLSEAARNRITQNANGIIEMVRLLEDMDNVSSTESRWRQVAHRLAYPRNQAAHKGLRPADEEVKGAVKEAKKLLDLYAPLPSPASIADDCDESVTR
ncbi:hypothetical protein [Actinophytocola sp.]|uniref:hypothetical protein n=1 Tax=Actinophytocola sp. TaxID=1872138 RepID=UPI003D6B9E25